MPIRFRNRFTIKANRIISSTIKNFGKIKIIPGVFAFVRSRTTVYGGSFASPRRLWMPRSRVIERSEHHPIR